MSDLEEEKSGLLMENPIKKSGKKKFIFTVLVIVAAIATIAAAVVITTPLVVFFGSATRSASSSPGMPFSYEDLFNTTYKPKYYNGLWVYTDNGPKMASVTEKGITIISPEKGLSEVLVPLNIFVNVSASGFKISTTLQYVLLIGPQEKVFRHSFLAEYYIFNVTSQSLLKTVVSPDTNETKLQYAEWSPVNNELLFVSENTLYVLNVESVAPAVNVTPQGRTDADLFGVPDWVYEEEMLATNHALWWSPEGNGCLFLEFLEKNVSYISFPVYGDPSKSYPSITNLKYPKAGKKNPGIRVFAKSLNGASMTDMIDLLPPQELTDQYYFEAGGWLNDTHIYVLWLNRTQNVRVYSLYDLTNSLSPRKPVRTVTELSNGWIESGIGSVPMLMKRSAKLLMIMSENITQESGSFLHLAEVNLETEDVMFITHGEWEVTEVIGVNEDDKDILYVSTKTHSWERHIYSTKYDICLTCNHKWNLNRDSLPNIPNECGVFSASCAETLQYCILHCHGPTIPFSLVVSYRNGTFEQVSLLERNSELIEAAKVISIPKTDYFTVPATKDEPQLYGRLHYPPNFDSGKQYPVLFSVYGGPYSQTILDVNLFSQLWSLYESASLNCIIVSVDGRGTGFRGDNFKYAVYRQLGKLETIDQIRAGRFLQGLSYVLPERIAIYGTSYGGYMAAMVGSSGSAVFKVAISRSPVVDWRYYDSIYTERYMGQPTPEDNLVGYNESSVLLRADQLRSVKLLLIHGTADDNVHFQNSAQFVKELTKSEVQFRFQMYTDKAHAISGEDNRKHLYKLIDNFLKINL